jgi:D-alanine--poly(phosphoribitol) ligase subunit 1
MSIYNIAQLFYKISDRYEKKKAISFLDDDFITYGQLNALSNRIARLFMENGVQRYDVICIFNHKTKLGYAAMLACLKLGVVYANIDPENPEARLEKIFDTCQPRIVVTDQKKKDNQYQQRGKKEQKFLNLYDPRIIEKINKLNPDNLFESDAVTGTNPAYIMFTSGSTGAPKGVLISHDNLLSFIKWSIERFNIDEHDVLANLNPIYFDNSVFDFYTSLFSGASMAAIPKYLMNNPQKIIEAVDQLGCTIWFSVPSLLIFLMTVKVINRNVLKDIRIFAFGGEGYPKKELKKLYDLYRNSSQFINVYGPTECTCICSASDIDDNTFSDYNALPLLGTINPNFDYVILDEQDKRAPSGQTGELCLMGPNVGLGYYNNIDKTNEVFINNPLKPEFYEKMYKTGDLVREKYIDGLPLLEFKGRKDNQIKHLGYRIELEEIETAIHKNKKVIQSVAVYKKLNDKFGEIIAFIATKNKLTESDIKHHLKGEIPDYMVPTKYIIVDQLPKNRNGKVDRNKLSRIT